MYFKIISIFKWFYFKNKLRNLVDGKLKKIIMNCTNTLENGVFSCIGDLSNNDLGKYILEYNDLCGYTKEIGNIDILAINSQRLISIVPSFINKDSQIDVLITLTYNK